MGNDETEQMKADIQRMAKDSLGVKISFDADTNLSHYRRGDRLLTFGELQEGLVVWGWYQEFGEDQPRVNSAFRLETGASGDSSYVLEDGSSFILDIEVGDPLDDAVEDCGEGEKRIYEAVPL